MNVVVDTSVIAGCFLDSGYYGRWAESLLADDSFVVADKQNSTHPVHYNCPHAPGGRSYRPPIEAPGH